MRKGPPHYPLPRTINKYGLRVFFGSEYRVHDFTCPRCKKPVDKLEKHITKGRKSYHTECYEETLIG